MPACLSQQFYMELPSALDDVLTQCTNWLAKRDIGTILRVQTQEGVHRIRFDTNAVSRQDKLKLAFLRYYKHPIEPFVLRMPYARDIVAPQVQAVVAPPVAVVVAATPAFNIVDLANGVNVGGRLVRKTLDVPPKVSVFDMIAAVTEQSSKDAWTIFQRLKLEHPEVSTRCGNFKFPGQGQRLTPVTDARGVVTIINLLPGRAAASFRAISADVLVRFLGGDLTLIAEIQRNAEAQAVLPADAPARLFGADVEARATREVLPPPFLLRSVTNVIDLRSSQLYFRQVMGEFANVHPRGRPDLALSAEEIGCAVFVKLGSMGQTDRQMQHQTAFKGSELVDSLLTVAQTSVEQKFKDLLMDRGMLFEGLHQSKTAKDTELLVIPTQEAYEELVQIAKTIVNTVHTSMEEKPLPLPLEALLSMEETKRVLAIEKTKQVVAESAARVADAKRVETEFEMLKFRVAHSLS